MTDIANNINLVKEKIAMAAKKAGRNIEEISLVAVSKTVDTERIKEAHAAGIKEFGENRAQDLRDKSLEISFPLDWHFIGYLQSNKVKYVLDKAVLIHSLDRLSLAKEIDKQAKKISKNINVLVQVNVSEEESKSGIKVSETKNFISEVAKKYSNIHIKGLMTIAPFVDDSEKVRPVFAKLKELQQRIKEHNIPGVEMDYLSMGMTNDYTVAIEEGANIVRIGTAIFGKRN